MPHGRRRLRALCHGLEKEATGAPREA